MEERSEYEISVDCLRRLTQQDTSDKFNLIIKYQPDKVINEYNIQTTLNKARAISNKINEIYLIDPTISQYELNIPKLFLNSSKEGEDGKFRYIKTCIDLIIKSTTDKISVSKDQLQIINIIRRFLGEKSDNINIVQINNINESISYLFTELHDDSIKYLSSHFKEIIDGGQLFELNDQIIQEIIDEYFNNKDVNHQESENCS